MMPDQSYVLQVGDTYEWSNDYLIEAADGFWQMGISRSLTALTTGDQSGTTAIVLNGKTDTKSNNLVLDNRTGLIWIKAPAASVGPASNGKLYWDDHIDRLEFSNNVGSSFTAGKVVTQAVSGATGLIRYVNNTGGHMALESVENGPFDTTNTITAPGGEGAADVDSFEFGNGEDIFSYCIAANLARLGGYTDWRVPNIFELATIMLFNVTNGNARPDASYFTFPGTNDLVWTSTHDATERGLHAIAPRFDNGGCSAGGSSEKGFDTGYVYLVRGPDLSGLRYCLPLTTRFTEMGINFFDDGFYRLGVQRSYTVMEQGSQAGTTTFALYNGDSHTIENKCILDDNTGMMWLFATSDHQYPYYDPTGKRGDALEYLRVANAYALGGFSDWRIPNLLEAVSVYDAATERIAEEVGNNKSYAWWTCTPNPATPANIFYCQAGRPWCYTPASRTSGGPYYVRLVRGGVTDADLPT